MTTPEGKVKNDIKDLLVEYDIRPAKEAGTYKSAAGWFFMPIGGPYAVKGIPDFMGVYHGLFWSIEAKAPGKEPTGFQSLQIGAIRAGTGKVFVVDGDLSEVREWLEENKR